MSCVFSIGYLNLEGEGRATKEVLLKNDEDEVFGNC